MNVFDELMDLKDAHNVTIKAANLSVGDGFTERPTAYTLYPDHSGDEYTAFLEQLATLDYDNGFGSQELHGYVWFTDGTWAERREYDGSEWWVRVTKPAFPARGTDKD